MKPGNTGRHNGNATLTEAQARLIIGYLKLPYHERPTAREIANIYGLATETVRRLMRGDTWLWLHEQMLKEESVEAYVKSTPATEEEKVKIAASLERLKRLNAAANADPEVKAKSDMERFTKDEDNKGGSK